MTTNTPHLHSEWLHGYLCFSATVPLGLTPAQIIQTLQEHCEQQNIDFTQVQSQAQAELHSLQSSLQAKQIPPLPTSIQSIPQDSMPHIPPSLLQWSSGFDFAGNAFSHLWEFWLSGLEKALAPDAEKLNTMQPFLDKIWEEVNTNWMALTLFTNEQKSLEAWENSSQAVPLERYRANLFSHFIPIWTSYCERLLVIQKISTH